MQQQFFHAKKKKDNIDQCFKKGDNPVQKSPDKNVTHQHAYRRTNKGKHHLGNYWVKYVKLQNLKLAMTGDTL